MKSVMPSSLLILILATSFASADVDKFAVKKIKKEAPKELAAEIRGLLGPDALQFTAKDGGVIAEIWLSAKLTGNVKVKDKKIAYNGLPQAVILGAVQFHKEWMDYREQKIKPGVYTLRYSSQPQDGDHMGTSPHPTFVVLISAKFDPKTGPYEAKELAERSAASINRTHPAVFLLFPNDKAKAQPELAARPNEHMILSLQHNIAAGGDNATLNLGLTLVGHAAE